MFALKLPLLARIHHSAKHKSFLNSLLTKVDFPLRDLKGFATYHHSRTSDAEEFDHKQNNPPIENFNIKKANLLNC